MYNFRLKSYGNGTAQLTYFHNPIRLKDDTYKQMPATQLDLMSDEGYDRYLYKKNDFEVVNVRKNYYADGTDAYLMLKEL